MPRPRRTPTEATARNAASRTSITTHGDAEWRALRQFIAFCTLLRHSHAHNFSRPCSSGSRKTSQCRPSERVGRRSRSILRAPPEFLDIRKVRHTRLASTHHVHLLAHTRRGSPKTVALSPRIRQVVLAFEEVARNERLKKYKLIDLPPQEQFRHTLYNLVHQTMAPETFTSGYKLREKPGLKKCPPYWYPYTSMAKGRWLGRELLEIVSTEFRDRSMEYYVRLRPCMCALKLADWEFEG